MSSAFRFSHANWGDHPPAAPAGCTRLVERARLQWRRGDPGDPAALVEAFLTRHGLPVADLSGPSRAGDPSSPVHDRGATHDERAVCGATVYLSAAAAADLAGAPAGATSPVAGLPDLVVVVWEHGGDTSDAAAGKPADPAWRVGAWRPSWTPHEHAEAVRSVQKAIAAGDVYQVNLVGHASAPYTGDPTGALRRVARLPGVRYAGVLRGHGWAVACASPETLVTVTGGRVVTRPIKGTRPATAQGRVELLTSAKERAEHIMIVDLERNDLGRLARTGEVRVDELFVLRRWCDLWQAESQVSARLRPGVGLAELLRAVCPGGSVTGAPKRAALELIAQLEPVGRGPAMAVLGWVDDARVDLGLTIRTVAVDSARVHVWAGGGITWSSDPHAEVAEAAAKAAPLRAALAGAAPGSAYLDEVAAHHVPTA